MSTEYHGNGDLKCIKPPNTQKAQYYLVIGCVNLSNSLSM